MWEEDDWEVSPTSYFNNSLVLCEAKKKRKLARLLQPANRRRWSMSIMSVNSYYDNAVNGLFISTHAPPRPTALRRARLFAPRERLLACLLCKRLLPVPILAALSWIGRESRNWC